MGKLVVCKAEECQSEEFKVLMVRTFEDLGDDDRTLVTQKERIVCTECGMTLDEYIQIQ